MMSLRLLYGKSFYKQKLTSFGDNLILESNLKENDCAQMSKNNNFLKNILTAWSKINYKVPIHAYQNKSFGIILISNVITI